MKRALSLAALLWAAPALANIDLSSTVVQVELPAGGSHAGVIQVKNVTKGRLKVSAIVEDWKYDQPGGSKKFFPSGTLPRSCGKWMSVSPQDFELDPDKTQEVRYTLTSPLGAEGGYNASITFSSTAPEAVKKEGIVITLAMKVGTLLLVEIEKTQKVQGVITEFAALSPQAGHPLEVQAGFKNTGNVRVEAKGRLSILDPSGNAVGWTQFPPVKTLPGDQWTVKAKWAAGLPAGPYHLVGTFELAPGVLIVKETDIRVK